MENDDQATVDVCHVGLLAGCAVRTSSNASATAKAATGSKPYFVGRVSATRRTRRPTVITCKSVPEFGAGHGGRRGDRVLPNLIPVDTQIGRLAPTQSSVPRIGGRFPEMDWKDVKSPAGRRFQAGCGASHFQQDSSNGSIENSPSIWLEKIGRASCRERVWTVV